jgi:hypothetical protein
MAQNVREGQSQPTDSRQYQPGEESNGIRQGPTSQPRRIGAHFPSDASYFQVARNVVATSMAGHLQPSRNEERTQDESSRPAVRTLPGTYANPRGGMLLIIFIAKLTPISLDSVFRDA